MKLFSVNFKVGRDIILNKFTKSVKSLLIIHKNNYINLYSMYTEEEIEDAINSIYYIDDAFYAPVWYRREYIKTIPFTKRAFHYSLRR